MGDRCLRGADAKQKEGLLSAWVDDAAGSRAAADGM